MTTPLEKLGDAIREFLAETHSLPPGAFVTGWTVVSTYSRIQADDPESLPLVTGQQYAIGPETSVVQAAGMAKFLGAVTERAMWQALNEEEDDD